jgi:hypothetical protein
VSWRLSVALPLTARPDSPPPTSSTTDYYDEPAALFPASDRPPAAQVFSESLGPRKRKLRPILPLLLTRTIAAIAALAVATPLHVKGAQAGRKQEIVAGFCIALGTERDYRYPAQHIDSEVFVSFLWAGLPARRFGSQRLRKVAFVPQPAQLLLSPRSRQFCRSSHTLT